MVSTIVWFRLDLRLADNPALAAAAARGGRVIPVYIWAPDEEGDWPPGAAGRWWLHRSLQALDRSLRRQGARLILRCGPSLGALRELIREFNADAVYFGRRVEPQIRIRDERVIHALAAEGVEVESFNSALLLDPTTVFSSTGGPYRVFTPFARACFSAMPDFAPLPVPALRRLPAASSMKIGEYGLEPEGGWAGGLGAAWRPGEAEAIRTLEEFADAKLDAYADGRNYPAQAGTSRLSPHLHFGEISPGQVWAACSQSRREPARAFLRQLVWREFAHHLLFHFPKSVDEPLRPQFSRFPWRSDTDQLRSWTRGMTGYPIVDAGMRELWTTGWMHNRVRMIVGSFLVKDLLLSWKEGARWFWDTLVDADLANNTLGWQWVAGCGADAAPYFRIFNPALQGATYDPSGEYAARWVAELKDPRYVPIVSHREARARALDALASIK